MSVADRIARALLTPGGHLSIGRGGFTLHHDNCRLSGYDCDEVKVEAIAAGLPVIDTRLVPFSLVAKLAVHGPMIAVNQIPDAAPWHGFSSAPLAAVATAYRQVGADVHNIADCSEARHWFAEHPLAPLDNLLDGWLAHVLRHAEAVSIDFEEPVA